MAWLVGLDGPLGDARFPLDGPCLVGRGPLNHVVLDDPRVSRQHAKISLEAGEHVVYDLNSANGTFVNDVAVRRHSLAPNDIVRFGPFRFRFDRIPEGDSAPTKMGPRVREVRTVLGMEPASTIVGSVDAASVAANPPSVLGTSRHSLLGANLSELEDADRKLRTVYAFMQSISMTIEATDLFDRIASSLLAIFPAAAQVVVYLRDTPSSPLGPRKVAARNGEREPTAFSLSPGAYEAVVEQGRAILSAATVMPMPGAAARGSVMHAPMIYRESTHGVLLVSAPPKSPSPFSQRDLDLLTALAAQAAMALQNLRMHGELLKQQRLARELALAQQIQKSFLPRHLPVVPGMDFFVEYQPAYSVGGDFYDVFWLSEGRLGLFIGDVAGKGVPAALLMARISSDLRVAALADPEPARVLTRVNRTMLEREQDDMFVTGIYMTLDVAERRIRLANGGHMAPIIRRRQGELEHVEQGTATAIGLFDHVPFTQAEVRLGHGDALILYTDGVVEATNLEGEQFGAQRFERSLTAGSGQTQEVAQRVLSDLRSHVGEAPQYDDLTLLVCGLA